MSWWGQSPIEELVEKATSELLPNGQENIALNLDISDQIRSKKINAKEAMRAIKKRMQHSNPNVQLATLSLADTCVKNAGELFVREVASREFMDELVSILKSPSGCNLDVKNKLLTVIQTWGLASRDKPVISYLYDTYSLLKAEGTQFPPERNVDSILLETTAAPEWSDSDVCDRCRTPFTITNRKHHCRNCGGTFCQQCSSKTLPLPHMGINEHVRVCDGCHIKIKLDKAAIVASTSIPSTKKPLPPPAATPPPPASDEFDDDIKKAIELSLKEAEQQKNAYGAGYVAPATQTNTVQEEDPDLAAAIAASLRDLEISKHQAPSVQVRHNDLSPVEMENILLFSTLMDRIYATGGDASNDTQITQLYTQIGALQPKLIKSLNETIQKRNAFIQLSEKLNAAVRAYDRVLEDKINNVRHQESYHIPQETNKYYPTNRQDVNPYYSTDTSYTTSSQNHPINYQASYAPPVDYNQTGYTPPADHTTMNQTQTGYSHNQVNYSYAPPAQPEQQKQQPVDEAPLIDLN